MDKIRNFLRKILGIQTLKIILFNHGAVDIDSLSIDRLFKGMPVFFMSCDSINDMKVIDTGIVVKKKE